MIGVSVATLRNWEQGRRTPDGPALALLRVAANNPKAVRTLYGGAKRGAAGRSALRSGGFRAINVL
jgi:putative transcriptional regulator